MRVRYILKCIYYWITEFRIHRSKSTNTKRLLFVHTDAIGDYLLLRNFIHELKQTETFKNYNFTLCGNSAYEDLATAYDKDVFHQFIWLNRSAFATDKTYRNTFLNRIREIDYDMVINPSYSRDFIFGDSIVRSSKSPIKIGQKGDQANSYFFLTWISNNWYTRLIQTASHVMFEFDRNKRFFEQITTKQLTLKQPSIPIPKKQPDNPYMVVFPGAGELQKQWPIDRFAKIASHISHNNNWQIIVCGSKSEVHLGNQFEDMLPNKNVVNLCGKTRLTELAEWIAHASLLVTNDSSALHFAACSNTPTLCICNGRHYGRFTPYPNELKLNLQFIFPAKVNELAATNIEQLQAQTIHKSIASIDDITVDDVLMHFKKLAN